MSARVQEAFSLTKSRTSNFDGGYNMVFELSRITIRWRVASRLSGYRRGRVHINVKFTVKRLDANLSIETNIYPQK